MKRDTVTAYRTRARATEAMIDTAIAEVKAEADAAYKARRDTVREANAKRHRFTHAELVDAVAIRDVYGWRKVARVNAKSVTVVSILHPSWTDRIGFDKVLEVRKAVAA